MIKQATQPCEHADSAPNSKPNVVTLDVREDLRKGREPFSKIMSTVASLGDDDQLLLIAPFEPAPLFRLLGQRGFSHTTRTTESGDWEVLFRRVPAPPVESASSEATSAGVSANLSSAEVEVDARGLEPPQPLVKILEAVAILPEGARLLARTDRRPMHLYPQLEERGFVAETQEESDGSFVTYIGRAATALEIFNMNTQPSNITMQTENLIGPDRVMDVRQIPCSIKHGLIIRNWLELGVGDHFVLLNDHDPVPLYYQFSALWPQAFTWEHLVKGPSEFRVKITKLRALEPMAEPVTSPCGGH